MGPLLSTAYPSGTPNVTQGWNRNGRLTSVSSSAASRAYTYDANDNLTAETLTVDSHTYAVNYGVDSLDYVTSITYPSNRVVTYAPDTLGRPTQVSPYATSVSHHPSGQVSGITFGNGVTSTTLFNSRQWPRKMTAVKVSTLVNLTYAYDVGGNLTSVTDAIDASSNRTLGYDAIDRLTAASGSWGTGTLAYDGDGDLTSQALGNFSLSYTYNTSNRLSSISGSKAYTFSYDAYGNVTNNGAGTFTYDNAPVLRCANCSTNPINYTYDGRNMLVKTVKSGVTTNSLYASNGDLLGEYSAAGNPIKEYAYLYGQPVAIFTSSGSVTTSYHVDASGSPGAATDQSGAVIWREAYRPYGERLKLQDGGSNSQWFAGKFQEAATGLSYFGARHYDPVIGRFMAVDPKEFDGISLQSFNRYAYGNNNPYKYKDPNGRETIVIVNNNTPLIGTHTGLMIRRAGDKLLYDPAGSYRNDVRGTGGTLDGNEANLSDYVQFQKADGPDVSVFRFDTTAEEEAQIKVNIERIGDPRGISCAPSVSGVLDGIGSFKNLGIFRTPKGLQQAMIDLKVKEKEEARRQDQRPLQSPPPERNP
ncbi:MAG: RHS repeat-associated core domain-containing protein [Pyrinomonadaceae bacterium]